MKSDKQRILEAYSEDLKAMYEIKEAKSSDVKKWIVVKPKYIADQTNIVDAYALLAEDDNYRQNKMRLLNEQIILKGKISKVKEIMDFASKEMERYIEGSQFENSGRFVEARDNFDEAKVTYEALVESYHDDDDDDEEEMEEGEGLKPAPAPSKHSSTNSIDGGDSSEGDAETSEIDDELDQVTEAKKSKIKFKEDMDKAKMDMDDIEDDDSEEMDEVLKKYKEAKKKYKEACVSADMMDEGEGEKPAPAPSKHDATDSVDGGLVTKQELGEADDDDDDDDDDEVDDKKEMNDIKENKEAYMKYAKGIIGDRDLSKMSDEDTKALFNKIDKGWNSKDEKGADGPV